MYLFSYPKGQHTTISILYIAFFTLQCDLEITPRQNVEFGLILKGVWS